MIKFGHLMYGDTLPIFTVLCPDIASLSLVGLAHFVVAAPHGVPHTGVFGPGEYSSAVVVESIIIHILELVSLSQPVPGSEVFGIDFNSISIGLNGARYILHFEILMTHQGPSGQAGSIKLEGFSEVYNRLEVFSHQRIVVADNAAGFRDVFVVVKLFQSEVGEFSLVFFDV